MADLCMALKEILHMRVHVREGRFLFFLRTLVLSRGNLESKRRSRLDLLVPQGPAVLFKGIQVALQLYVNTMLPYM